MAGFKTVFFKGIRPRLSSTKLPEGEGVTAINLKLGSGDLVPWDADDSPGLPVDDTFKNKTIYRYDNDGSPLWFEWSDFVSVARGTIKGDTRERIYYTGDGPPKMTYRAIATAGGAPYPTSFRNLGIPSPIAAPTARANDLPEDRTAAERRVQTNTMFTKFFEIAFVNWTVHPGTGTATAEWVNPLGGLFTGDIHFDLNEGDTIKVLEVLDKDTVTLGSATGTGAFAETVHNDKDHGNTNWNSMANIGSTQVADWIGWRIPDGLKASISDHLLRVGDIIRVTRLDYPEGLVLTIPSLTLSFYEQAWGAEGSVTVNDVTFQQVVNVTVGADAAGEADFAALKGGFFYDVVRADSVANTLEDRTYIYTYVSSIGEEGPPSLASLVVGALDGDAVEVTVTLPPTDNLDIVTIRLYRTSSTIAGTEYQFVKDYAVDDIVESAVVESVKQANLGEIISTTTWCGPPAGMQGITEMPNGMLVGFVGRTIHMCEPFFPHAWPPEYDQAVDYEIVGLAAFGNSIVVLTEGTPYVLSGSHPRNVNIRPYKINQACVSAESIASNVDKVIYASPDGLVEIGVNGARLVTDPYVKKSEWADFSPTTMVGEFHDGKYFGFFDGDANVPQAPESVAITGTLATEAGVIAGGETILLTLTSDTWVSAGANFNAERQNIIDGLVARDDDRAPTNFITGFNIQVRPNLVVGDVVRTSDTLVTITLSAQAGYSITVAETIFSRVPDTALVDSTIELRGDVGLTIDPLEDFSTIAIAFSERDSADLDVPFAIASHKDITDWDEWAGVGTIFKEEADIDAAAFSPALNRWLAVGQRSNAAPTAPNTNVFSTSDNHGVNWTLRQNVFNLFADTTMAPLAAIWDYNHDTFVVGGENLTLQASPDGEFWTEIPVDLLVPGAGSIVEFALSTAGVPNHIYAAVSSSNFLLRSPDLKLAPVTNTWTSVAITYVSSTGSKQIASGASVVLSIGADNTDMEVCSTVAGAASGSSVGAISTYNCRGLVFGDDLWVAVSNDFRITTVASGSQGTIGNWSSPSTTKASGVNVKGIVFDKGDGVTQGYGYIVFGEITSSSLGVIYTSPDATTWTLRHTMTDTVDVDAMAVKYPERLLGDAFTAFAPTFNGARSPSTIGDITADYEGLLNVSIINAVALCNITCEVTGSDAILRISGVTASLGSDAGGTTTQADTTIFNLNQSPDKVRITMTEIDTGESSTTLQSWMNGVVGGYVLPIFGVSSFPDLYRIGDFTDNQFFSLIGGFEYGYAAQGQITLLSAFTPPSAVTSGAVCIITFTFQKDGFADLSVSYKIRAIATATFI